MEPDRAAGHLSAACCGFDFFPLVLDLEREQQFGQLLVSSSPHSGQYDVEGSSWLRGQQPPEVQSDFWPWPVTHDGRSPIFPWLA